VGADLITLLRVAAAGMSVLVCMVAPPVETTAATPVTFEWGRCPATSEPVPALAKARCGFLVVPENRSKSDGGMIRLPVAIIPALSGNPPADPIVYMEGGPGGAALPSAQGLVAAGLHRNRDVIVMRMRAS